MRKKVDSRKKRPWYSFRWRILFWIALPFILISIADSFAMWWVANQQTTEEAGQDQIRMNSDQAE